MANTQLVQYTSIGAVGAHRVVSVVNFAAATGEADVTPAAALALGASFFGDWKTQYQPIQTTAYTHKSYHVAVLGPVAALPTPPFHLAPSLVYSSPPISATYTGTYAGDYLPSFNAAYVLQKTASGLRRYRSGFHLGGIPEGLTTGQNLSAGTPAIIDAIYALVQGAARPITVGATTWNFKAVIFSKKYCVAAGVGAKPWDYANYITSGTTRTRLGSQLSRKLKIDPV